MVKNEAAVVACSLRIKESKGKLFKALWWKWELENDGKYFRDGFRQGWGDEVAGPWQRWTSGEMSLLTDSKSKIPGHLVTCCFIRPSQLL